MFISYCPASDYSGGHYTLRDDKEKAIAVWFIPFAWSKTPEDIQKEQEARAKMIEDIRALGQDPDVLMEFDL